VETKTADLEETIASGIADPWVVVGAPDAGLQVDGLPGNLLGGQLAGVGHPAGGLALDHALLPPGLEVLDLADSAWVLHPLDHLGHGHEVHVVVVGQDLVDPVEEGVEELGVVLQPGGVEVAPKDTYNKSVFIYLACKMCKAYKYNMYSYVPGISSQKFAMLEIN